MVSEESVASFTVRQNKTWRVKEARLAEGARNVVRLAKGRPVPPVHPKPAQVTAYREIALFSHMWNFACSGLHQSAQTLRRRLEIPRGWA